MKHIRELPADKPTMLKVYVKDGRLIAKKEDGTEYTIVGKVENNDKSSI